MRLYMCTVTLFKRCRIAMPMNRIQFKPGRSLAEFLRGSVMERTKLPPTTRFLAMYWLTESKRGSVIRILHDCSMQASTPGWRNARRRATQPGPKAMLVSSARTWP